MSWSIEEHIGEGRPWPAQIVVYRGETDECLAYVSGEVADSLKAENAKLRELVARMAEALGIDCEWADPDWCKSPCVLEFGCWPEGDHTEIRCPAWAAMRELGVEVSE